MTVEIKYQGETCEIIDVKNAYVLGLKFSDKSSRVRNSDTDELQLDKPYTFLARVLPNGTYIELLIIKTDGETAAKYKGFTAFSLDNNGVRVSATL